MSGHSVGELVLFYFTVMIAAVQIFTFKRLWDEPLKNGPGFFLGAAVPPGFYEGEGTRWLGRYRTAVVAVDLILAAALAGILLSGRWYLLAAWAGSAPVLQVPTLVGFRIHARFKLGQKPVVQPRVAISLEPRRLGEYLSWRGKALTAAVIAFSWVLLLTRGGAQVQWAVPVVITYFVVGQFLFEMGIVHRGFPLPADRPEEHQQWLQAQRQHVVRSTKIVRWFLVLILASYAVWHGLRWGSTNLWLYVSLIGIVLPFVLTLTVTLIHGERQLATLSRNLRPVGDWPAPFRQARILLPAFAIWFAAWVGGLVLLLVFFRR
jgi:hypothetical protein